MCLNILLLLFSVAAVKTSLLAHISILDRGGGLRESESSRGGIGDFHRAPLHLWVIMATCEEFPSLAISYRQNVLNLKCTCRKISLALFPDIAERLRIVALKRFDVRARRQVLILSCARFSLCSAHPSPYSLGRGIQLSKQGSPNSY